MLRILMKLLLIKSTVNVFVQYVLSYIRPSACLSQAGTVPKQLTL